MRKVLFTVLLTSCLIGLLSGMEKETKAVKSPQKVKVLILTGAEMGSHNWRTRTKALQEILAVDSRFEVGVEEDPEFLAQGELFQYDVILMNFYSGKKDYPGKKSKENLTKFVGEQGKGLFVLHYACGNFKGWSE